MKTLLIALSLALAATACSKKTPEQKFNEQRMEANKDYNEEIRDDRQDMEEANKDYREEASDVRQDMEEAAQDRKEEIQDARKDLNEDLKDQAED